MKIMGDVAIVTFGFGDPDIGWHISVVTEQDMDFNTTLGPAEFGPGEQVEAQRDSRRVKAEQFVFESELAFAIASRPAARNCWTMVQKSSSKSSAGRFLLA